jgi:hypothetical protein
MTTKKKTGRKSTKAKPAQRTIKPLPDDVFPPLKLAKFLNGKLVGIEEIPDPRKQLTEFFNAQQERLGSTRRMGPVQGDPEDWIYEEAERYHADLENRMADVEAVPDVPFADFLDGFNAKLDGMSAALAGVGKAVQA